ncbi:hypothetical protein bcgnr5390_11930 [Bacillus luti]|nr:hypothetical protein BC2903_28970 [Bacillus cereus]
MKKKFILGLTMAAVLGSFAPSFGEGHVAKAAEKKLWNPIPGYMEKTDSFNARLFAYDKGDITEDQIVKKKVLYLNQPTLVFDEDPVYWASKPNGMVLAPQLVQFIEAKRIYEPGGKGYAIKLDTWAGPKWIKWIGASGKEYFPGMELNYPKNTDGDAIFQSINNKTNIPIYKTPGKYGVAEAYIAPQSLKVTSVGVGDEYLMDSSEFYPEGAYIGIQTWLGERWIKSSDLDSEVLNKMVYPVNKMNSFELLDSPERKYNQSYYAPAITSQEVFAIERKGTFVKIKTWLGEKWIESDEFIEDFGSGDLYKAYYYGALEAGILDDAVYYDNVNFKNPLEKVNNKAITSFDGALQKKNGEVWFYASNGKWISSKDIKPIVNVSGSVENKQNLKRYYSNLSVSEGEIAPQKFNVSKKLGEWYWYEVSGVVYGPNWVHPEQGDVITVTEKDYNIAATTKLYKNTSTHESQFIEDITPQVVKEVGRVKINDQKWVEIKIPGTGKQGFILEK